MRIIITLIILYCCQLQQKVFAQTTVVDSLRNHFFLTSNEKDKLNTAVLILDEYESLYTDTIANYYYIAEKLLQKNFSTEIFLQLSVTKIRLLRRQSKFEEALQLCDSSIAASASATNRQLINRKLIAVKTAILISQRKYKEALEISFSALKKAEQEKDDTSQIYSKITIGWINMEITKNNEALKWFFDAIAHSNKIGYTLKKGITYANIAAVYAEMKKIDSAEFYIQKAFDVAFKHNNLTVQANCHYIYSDILVEKRNITGAENAMTEGMKIRKKIGDPYFYVSDLYQLAVFYANNKQAQKGITASLEGIAFAEKNKLSGKYLILYDALAQNYKVAGNEKLYSHTLEKIILLKDSLYKNNSAQALADLQTKYDVQKKETLIAKQKLSLIQRNLLLYGAGVLAAALAVFFGYRFRKYQKSQKLIAEQKKLQSELAVKDAEEKERKRIAAELHDNLGVQANAILHNSTLLNLEKESNKNVVTDLQETAKEMLLNLRETLWAMKVTDVTAEDLWLRIINFMKQMGRHYNHLTFEIQGLAPKEFLIPSTKALNIVLVIQEIINNAVKHAEAKTITAKSHAGIDNWQLIIEDNGKGFNIEEAKQKNDSYGLTNMQERAKSGNFSYAVQSYLSKGTTTTITLKK